MASSDPSSLLGRVRASLARSAAASDRCSIEPLKKRDIAAAGRFDSSFLVESHLRLRMDDGVLAYDVEPVAPYRKQYEADDLSDVLNAPDKAIFVARRGRTIVGRVAVSEHWNGYALIEDIAVAADERGGGTGRALLDRAVEWARQRKRAGVTLETQHNNVAACRFYERYGFELAGCDRLVYSALGDAANEIALYWYLRFDTPADQD